MQLTDSCKSTLQSPYTQDKRKFTALNLLMMQPTVMNLACTLLGMSMPEALIAATLNAAASLGRGSTHGAIQKGRVGDLVIINADK
jgi:imidazolonepropionase-like amidohydrolase